MKFTKKKTSIIAFMLLLTVVITGISACSNDNSKAGKEVKKAEIRLERLLLQLLLL